MSMPAISVLMPVYNAEKYIVAAVESILSQIFTDFEFIIINDGSTDGSLAILEKYALQDKRIRLISRENKGLVASLNEGIALARAPLIARMDADDLSLPNRLATQKTYMDNNLAVNCIGGISRVIDSQGRFLINTDTTFGAKKVEEMALSGRSPITHPTAMIRTDSLRFVGGYKEQNFPAEDLALWLELSEVGEINNIEEVLLEYRIHDTSISTMFHESQLDKTREICTSACIKRGVDVEFTATVGRPGKTRKSKFEVVLRHGWWAFGSKQWRTSAIYAVKAISIMPFLDGGWRLLMCSFLRRG